jgi:3-hydroxyacyl-[acyl-carrier-protein] dehydratase
MNTVLNIEEIKKILPHRGPALFIDRAYFNELLPKQIFVVRLIEPSIPELEGHLPGRPIYPGYRYLEIANLGAALLINKTFPEFRGTPGIVSHDGIKYKHQGLIGDKIFAIVNLIKANLRRKHFTFSAVIKNQKNQPLCIINEFSGMAI